MECQCREDGIPGTLCITGRSKSLVSLVEGSCLRADNSFHCRPGPDDVWSLLRCDLKKTLQLYCEEHYRRGDVPKQKILLTAVSVIFGSLMLLRSESSLGFIVVIASHDNNEFFRNSSAISNLNIGMSLAPNRKEALRDRCSAYAQMNTPQSQKLLCCGIFCNT